MPGPDFTQPEKGEDQAATVVTMDELHVANPDTAKALESVFEKTPLEQITQETGLTLNELSQQIAFSDEAGNVHQGTVAEAIAEAGCPAGTFVRRRFANKGLEGVQRLFDNWAEDEPSMGIVVSMAAWRHEKERLAHVEAGPADHHADTDQLKKKPLAPTHLHPR